MSFHWADEHTDTLKLIHQMCLTHAEAYHDHYEMTRRKMYRYRIPIIGISTVMGLLSVSNGGGYVSTSMTDWVSLLVGIGNFTMAVGAINLLEKIQRSVIDMNTAEVSSNSFRALGNDLSIDLRTPVNQRSTDGKAAVNAFYVRFQQILNSSPSLHRMPPNLLTMVEYSLRSPQNTHLIALGANIPQYQRPSYWEMGEYFRSIRHSVASFVSGDITLPTVSLTYGPSAATTATGSTSTNTTSASTAATNTTGATAASAGTATLPFTGSATASATNTAMANAYNAIANLGLLSRVTNAASSSASSSTTNALALTNHNHSNNISSTANNSNGNSNGNGNSGNSGGIGVTVSVTTNTNEPKVAKDPVVIINEPMEYL
jgi:hypothetical protein